MYSKTLSRFDAPGSWSFISHADIYSKSSFEIDFEMGLRLQNGRSEVIIMHWSNG